jgi:hypothetical protein
MANLDVVGLLKQEHERLTKQIQGIAAALSAFGATYGKRNGSGKKTKVGGVPSKGMISAAGRARIAEAQRQRWAKLKGTTGHTKSAAAAAPKRRPMSAAARKKIAAAQRLRWSKVKASQKKPA